jgi:hypothetical protein
MIFSVIAWLVDLILACTASYFLLRVAVNAFQMRRKGYPRSRGWIFGSSLLAAGLITWMSRTHIATHGPMFPWVAIGLAGLVVLAWTMTRDGAQARVEPHA